MLARHAEGFDPRDLRRGRASAGGRPGRAGRRPGARSRRCASRPRSWATSSTSAGPPGRRRRCRSGVSPRGATALLATVEGLGLAVRPRLRHARRREGARPADPAAPGQRAARGRARRGHARTACSTACSPPCRCRAEHGADRPRRAARRARRAGRVRRAARWRDGADRARRARRGAGRRRRRAGRVAPRRSARAVRRRQHPARRAGRGRARRANSGRAPLRGRVRDAWPPSRRARAAVVARSRSTPADGCRLTTVLVPTRRGERSAAGVTIRSRRPARAGRAAAHPRRAVDGPGAAGVHQPRGCCRRSWPGCASWTARSSRLVRGQGSEFDSLRSYVRRRRPALDRLARDRPRAATSSSGPGGPSATGRSCWCSTPAGPRPAGSAARRGFDATLDAALLLAALARHAGRPGRPDRPRPPAARRRRHDPAGRRAALGHRAPPRGSSRCWSRPTCRATVAAGAAPAATALARGAGSPRSTRRAIEAGLLPVVGALVSGTPSLVAAVVRPAARRARGRARRRCRPRTPRPRPKRRTATARGSPHGCGAAACWSTSAPPDARSPRGSPTPTSTSKRGRPALTARQPRLAAQPATDLATAERSRAARSRSPVSPAAHAAPAEHATRRSGSGLGDARRCRSAARSAGRTA